MSRETDLQRVLNTGLVAVVRAPDGKHLVDVVAALAEGGVSVAEVTFTVPGALDIIKAVAKVLTTKGEARKGSSRRSFDSTSWTSRLVTIPSSFATSPRSDAPICMAISCRSVSLIIRTDGA